MMEVGILTSLFLGLLVSFTIWKISEGYMRLVSVEAFAEKEILQSKMRRSAVECSLAEFEVENETKIKSAFVLRREYCGQDKREFCSLCDSNCPFLHQNKER